MTNATWKTCCLLLKGGIFILAVFFLQSLCSCERTTRPNNITYFTQDVYGRADTIRVNRSAREAIQYLDSIYAAHPEISIADKYQYYMFQAELHVRFNQNRYNADSALIYTDSMLLLIEKNNMTKKMASEYAKAYSMKGDYYAKQKRYNEAIKAISISKFISLQNGDSCTAGDAEATLGSIAYQQSRYLQAVSYYKESLHLSGHCESKQHEFYVIQGNLDNLGLSYARLGKSDSALVYYEKALSYIEQNKSVYSHDTTFVKIALSLVYDNIASLFVQEGKHLDSAEAYLLKNIHILTNELGDSSWAASTRIQLATLYIKTGRISQASRLLNEAKRGLPFFNEQEKLIWIKAMWEAAAKRGDEKEELAFIRQYATKRDSLEEKQNADFPVNFETEYEQVEKIYEISLLKKDAQIQTIYLTTSVIVGILLITLALLIFLSLRRSRKMVRVTRKLNDDLAEREQQLKQLLADLERRKEKERAEELFLQEVRLRNKFSEDIVTQRRKISDDMHDELASSLAALTYYVTDLKMMAGTDENRKPLEEIEAEVKTIYQNSRSYIHNLKTGNMESEYDLPSFLSEISTKFSEKTSLRIQYNINGEIKQHLNVFEHNQLYHIVKEAISNIIKHAAATLVSINIEFKNRQCFFSITDNGAGFNKEDVKYGLGLSSIRSRLINLDGSMDIVSNDSGTRMEGSFPFHTAE